MTNDFSAVILAAGKGTRFKSDKIKVLHRMLGKSMLHLVADCLFGLDPRLLFVVVGHQKELVMKESFSRPVRFAVQEKPLGTADAVLAVRDHLRDHDMQDVLIMNADLPLVQTRTLQPFLDFHRKERNSLTFLTGDLEDPTGFGRVIPGANGVIRIVEEREATPRQRKIKESNLGVYCFHTEELFLCLPKISNDNAKKEFYLTDIIEIMMRDGNKCRPFKTGNTDEFIGVNDRKEFEDAVEVLRKRKLQALADKGVRCLDDETCRVDLDVPIGERTVLHSDVVIQGDSSIGSDCQLYSHVRLHHSQLGRKVCIGESAVLERSFCGDESQIGPGMYLADQTIPTGMILQGKSELSSPPPGADPDRMKADNKHRGGS